MTNTTTYTAEYKITADTDEPTRNSLAAIDYPQTLGDVRDTCRNLGVSATLRDEPGFVRGYVNSIGDHSLA